MRRWVSMSVVPVLTVRRNISFGVEGQSSGTSIDGSSSSRSTHSKEELQLSTSTAMQRYILSDAASASSNQSTLEIGSSARELCETSGKSGDQHTAPISDTDLLLSEGFSEKQAARVLSFYSSVQRKFNIHSTRSWLKLLQELHMGQSLELLCRNPIILTTKFETSEANAKAIVGWVMSMGSSEKETAILLRKRPMLLVVPLATAAAVSTWLSTELGWSKAMMVKVLIKDANLFCSSPVNNLTPKLAWFKSIGFSNAAISKVLCSSPNLFTCTTARNEAQLVALQAMGLSRVQVQEMIRKLPVLVTYDVLGAVVQAKVQFLTIVMKKQVQELVWCPVFLCVSLLERTGPRWSFHSVYCDGQPFKLGTNLVPTDANFVARLRSPSLDAVCRAGGISRLQVYHDFKQRWQQREGTEWDVGKSRNMLL